MKELTYEEVLDQIEHQRRFGNRPGAEVSALMLEKLGRPQQNMSVIHIAGTNGKGSVSAFLLNFKGSRDSYRNVYLTAPG